jgi:hypothetical protein
MADIQHFDPTDFVDGNTRAFWLLPEADALPELWRVVGKTFDATKPDDSPKVTTLFVIARGEFKYAQALTAAYPHRKWVEEPECEDVDLMQSFIGYDFDDDDNPIEVPIVDMRTAPPRVGVFDGDSGYWGAGYWDGKTGAWVSPPADADCENLHAALKARFEATKKPAIGD